MDIPSQTVVLHPGSKMEVALHIQMTDSNTLLVSADLSREASVQSENRIDREKYRVFSNVVHAAVYAAPKNAIRMKPSYHLSTQETTGQASCSISLASAEEGRAIIDYLGRAASAARADSPQYA
jgi:hypothetical protein